MSWTLGRLGSRFSLLFEPHQRRVTSSALGRFLDAPLDLAVGLVEPDGTRRVLPFTTDMDTGDAERLPAAVQRDHRPGRNLTLGFDNPEQFERINSITYRGYSAAYGLRFEFNVHSVFYPQDRRLCLSPAFYLEMRVHAAGPLRHAPTLGPTPSSVPVFIRIRGSDRQAVSSVSAAQLPRLDFSYTNPLQPEQHPRHAAHPAGPEADPDPLILEDAGVRERLVSLNPGAWALDVSRDDGGPHARPAAGLRMDLPVSDAGEGVKWRLVWAAHTPDPVLAVSRRNAAGRPVVAPARLAYSDHLPDLDAVVADAIEHRDDRLARSRRFEKMIGQAPLDASEQHLLCLSFQNYLANTWWCTGELPEAEAEAGPERTEAQTRAEAAGERQRLRLAPGEGRRFPWFSTWEGSTLVHSTVDVEYNASLFAMSLWPDLLSLQLQQWAAGMRPHAESGGGTLDHDLGTGTSATGQRSRYRMAVEENSNFLLLLQAYARWTGDRRLAERLEPSVRMLAAYLLWTDQARDGFPDNPGDTTLTDAPASLRGARRQTYIAVKRIAALQAAGDLLQLIGDTEEASRIETVAEADADLVEAAAWLGDHYVIASDSSALERTDPATGKPMPFEEIRGTDAYSIHTANGLLLPAMVGRPPLLNLERLRCDLISADRECTGRYGGGHSSDAIESIRVSLNIWRDLFARYLGLSGTAPSARYWDLQVMSNTGQNSLGYTDAYVNDVLSHYPRGVVTLGWFMATPRLRIDRLAPGGPYITVEPDRHTPQRWPLLPLADWAAGKVPVCVVGSDGKVHIESQTDPVIIHGEEEFTGIDEVEFIG